MDYHLLFESVGLANRKPGQIFRNAAGDEIIFQNLEFYPDSGGADNAEELDQFIRDQETILGSNIIMTNLPNPKMLGVGIAAFTKSDGSPVYFGRYFQQINRNRSDNNWPNNAIPGGYLYQGAAAKKATSGLMPQDVLKKFDSLYPEDILNDVIEKFGDGHPLTEVTRKIVNGHPLPISFPAGEIEFTGFRDYFCEMLQPIALIRGQYTGNAGDAAAKFLKSDTFEDCLIDFSTGKSTGLYDSLLTNIDGKQIKVSSKGGAGAKASVKNLIDTVNEIEKSGDKKFGKRYKETIDLVKEIQAAGQNNSPLILAKKFKLLDDKEIKIVQDLRNNPDIRLTPKLQEIYNSKPGRDPARDVPYYRMLAAIAHRVAKLVNENTSFSDDARDILNNGALVQVYTTAVKRGDQIVLEDFNTVYPSTEIKGVFLDASKPYYNTGIHGNFTFKIDKGSGPPPDEPEVEQPSEVPDKPQRTSIRPRGVERRERSGREGEEEKLGRARR